MVRHCGRDTHGSQPADASGSAQDEHDDDDEEDEAKQATADVDPGCKQHADSTTQGAIVSNRRLRVGGAGYLVDIRQKESRSKMDSNLDQAKGRIKQAAADLTDDKDLKREGKNDEAAGKAKNVVADLKDKTDDLIDKVRDRAKKD
jgi:uncharacterized protein YjbJ (UPF0337 family)